MKKILVIFVLCVSFVLTACSSSTGNEYKIINPSKDVGINYIFLDSVVVNDEVYTLYVMEKVDGELIPQTLAVCYYTDENDVEYKFPCTTTTPILNNGRFYHSIELLETNRLTISDLEKMGLSFEVVED